MLAQYDADRRILLIFHATLIQGFCSGLVAGAMGYGSAYSGLKHSLILVAISVPDLYYSSGWREGQAVSTMNACATLKHECIHAFGRMWRLFQSGFMGFVYL